MICYLCVKSIEDNIFKNLVVKLIKVFLVDQNVIIEYYLDRVIFFFLRDVIDDMGFIVFLFIGILFSIYYFCVLVYQ